MSGIYIHIPFCRQACHYCNFHFSTSLRYKNELIDALLKEIELQRRNFNDDAINTVYFGGGTPSLCSIEDINTIVTRLRAYFNIVSTAEITLEANPDDITAEKLEGWKHSGINRLSIGIQSFFEEDLAWMNRAHNASQAVDCLQLAIKNFNNITVDLIYGSPGLTMDKWKQNVDTVLNLGIPHLSCYALTVEPKTPLDKMIRQAQSPPVDPDIQSEQFLLLMDWLERAGYEHYEISNFARPGHRSQHNSSYWQGKNYLGLGPSAHSFDGQARWWNIANNNKYIESINNGIVPFEKEILTAVQKKNEYTMISLRTAEGLGLLRFDEEGRQHLATRSQKYINEGYLLLADGFLKLTRRGKLLADGIAADLFFD